MQLIINGQMMTFRDTVNQVDTLLQELDLKVKTVVIELNRRVLTREDHRTTLLKDGDSIEIVHFVGGG